jgi:hypothetical protein|tara:strand:+ start:2028 stop:2444 length:417 start_codon:yes stop_codon:yes gene_type:complete
MNKRLKEINEFINSIKTQEEYNDNLEKKFLKYKTKFKELENYEPIKNLQHLYSLKMGGYIRYVNFDGELRYGGILLKIFESENDSEFNKKNLIILQNIDNNKFTISWEKNYIFYKSQTKKGDNLRELFISLIDKDNMD